MIFVKSPTRVDLSGGTLDMWPLYNFTQGATTINVAIDIWTSAEIIPFDTNKTIEIQSLDYQKNWKFNTLTSFLDSNEPQLHLYQVVLKYFSSSIKTGFCLKTKSESPIGGGLGGSSSLMITMMKAFSEWTEKKFIDVHHMVRVAHNLEAQILNTPTGTQDYYPAVTGGLSLIDYNSDQINQQVMDFSGTPLETHFLLVYTGKTHHSGLNNFEVLKSAVAKDQVVLKALNEIKIISTDLEQVLKNQSWSEIPDLFKREYSARVQLTPAFTSPEINFLSELVLANGGLGVKICGAGGGGCVLVWVAPENRQKVIEACEKEKFQCLNSKPVHPEKHQLKKWLTSSDS